MLAEVVHNVPACPADLKSDGVLDLTDIVMFITAFDSGDPMADFNNNGVYDLADIVAFVVAFEAGCP